MKTKFTLLLFFALLTGSFLQAQTKIIAHKSHSGKAATFNIHSVHNFGLSPMIYLDTLIRLSDSIFVEIMHEHFSKSAWKDTILYNSSNKNYYRKFNYHNRSLEELEAEMPKTVFIGFEEVQEQKTYPHLVPFIIPKQSDVPKEEGQQ